MKKLSRNAGITLVGGQSNVISEEQGYNSIREVIYITNLNPSTGENIYIAVDSEAVYGSGIILTPGQSVVFSKDSGYTPSQKRFCAYVSTTGSVSIYEEILIGGY
jgi:hypothetical protein